MDADKVQELNHHTSLANSLMSEISSTAYTVGYALAFGMNWADKDKNWLECILYSLLSWVNVGYLVAHR